MKRLLLETNLNKIYVIVMILISLFLLGGYFSYAMFTVSKEKKNAISIVTGNLVYKLEVDGKESNVLEIGPNSSKDFIITLSNPNNRKARFNFYYVGSLPVEVKAGYLVEEGVDTPPQEVGINLEKMEVSGSSNTYKIKISNPTNKTFEVTLGVSVGLDYNDLTLKDNEHLFGEYDGFLVSDIINYLSSENIYNDGEDTFITGKDPNNYIWYSGKLWRTVSVNNESKTTKLVTQWNISAIPYNAENNTAFKDSYMEDWLNDTTVDGFLGNLREPEKFIVMDSKWNATMTESENKPPKTTIVTDAVGLLTYYEYVTSYRGTTPSNSYLNNVLDWWCLTPFSNSYVRSVYYYGDGDEGNPIYTRGVRPSVNLKSDVKIINGNGTLDNPYRLKGDNDNNLIGTKLNTRYSGEYIRFGTGENNLYMIVSHEAEGLTKITSAEPLKDLGVFKTSTFGSDITFSSTNIIGAFLNDDYLTSYVGNDDINIISDSTTWYLGTIEKGESYKLAKYKDFTGSALTTKITIAKVGLLRLGELGTGQFEKYENNTTYWTLTPYSDSSVRGVYYDGRGRDDIPSYTHGIRPSFNLKSNVIIIGGEGTKQNPFTIELSN